MNYISICSKNWDSIHSSLKTSLIYKVPFDFFLFSSVFVSDLCNKWKRRPSTSLCWIGIRLSSFDAFNVETTCWPWYHKSYTTLYNIPVEHSFSICPSRPYSSYPKLAEIWSRHYQISHSRPLSVYRFSQTNAQSGQNYSRNTRPPSNRRLCRFQKTKNENDNNVEYGYCFDLDRYLYGLASANGTLAPVALLICAGDYLFILQRFFSTVNHSRVENQLEPPRTTWLMWLTTTRQKSLTNPFLPIALPHQSQ